VARKQARGNYDYVTRALRYRYVIVTLSVSARYILGSRFSGETSFYNRSRFIVSFLSFPFFFLFFFFSFLEANGQDLDFFEYMLDYRDVLFTPVTKMRIGL